MPAPVLTSAARITCAHGGQVALIPKQTKVLAGASPVLREGDVAGSPIAGCPIPLTLATAPCTAVVSELAVPEVGMAPRVLAVGKPVLLSGLSGVTNGIPPAPIVVVFAGQTKVLA